MTTNEYLKKFCKANMISYQNGWITQLNRPYAVCADGFGVSIQASNCHYCEPRISQYPGNDFTPYETVELGYPSEADEDLLPYQECPDREDPTESVYGYVPVSVVDKVIEKHGGIDIPATWDYFKDQRLDVDEVDPWWDSMNKVFLLIDEEAKMDLDLEVYYGKIGEDFPNMEPFDTEEGAKDYIYERTGAKDIREDHIYTNYSGFEYYYTRAKD